MFGAATSAEQCSHAPQGPRTWAFIISLPAIAAPVTISCTQFLELKLALASVCGPESQDQLVGL